MLFSRAQPVAIVPGFAAQLACYYAPDLLKDNLGNGSEYTIEDIHGNEKTALQDDDHTKCQHLLGICSCKWIQVI